MLNESVLQTLAAGLKKVFSIDRPELSIGAARRQPSLAAQVDALARRKRLTRPRA